MKKILLFLFLGMSLQLCAQQEDAWVYFKDKPNYTTFLASPLSMLSQRALDRRTRLHIDLDSLDAPIEASYYTQIQAATGIRVLAKSKWLNALQIRGTKANIDALKNGYTFIKKIDFANKKFNSKHAKLEKAAKQTHRNKFEVEGVTYNYGNATNQIQMLKGNYLHQQGFTGKGMQIAVLDAGFPNVNTLSAFKRLRDNNQILGGYNYADRSTNFYTGNGHGTNVLSTIGGYIDGSFIGSAPDASFYLFITEINETETPLEESLWVEAAERVDSLGVDVITTSLGYSTFDNTNYSYTYASMDGKTTFISRGAEIGASRGLLIVAAAGNEGDNSWHYISAPSDAKSVFAVGAVDPNKKIAPFSSFGPSSDGRVKPDLLAEGQNVYVLNSTTGSPYTSNGTSFATPIMAGVIACFWQAFPNLSNTAVMQLIRESADRYQNPTSQYGYGIPNFQDAYAKVLSVETANFINKASIYPNPVASQFKVQLPETSKHATQIKILNLLGKVVLHQENVKNGSYIDVSTLNSGIYLLQLSNKDQQKTIKLIKR